VVVLVPPVDHERLRPPLLRPLDIGRTATEHPRRSEAAYTGGSVNASLNLLKRWVEVCSISVEMSSFSTSVCSSIPIELERLW